ncbi:MAG: ABC transporter ATP-binding protein [Pseudomonadota bacterium]
MLAYFERLISPTQLAEDRRPPDKLGAFFWYFIRQIKGVLAASLFVALVVAVLDVMVPVFLGVIVDRLATSEPSAIWAESWPLFVGMAFLVLVARPVVATLHNMLIWQGLIPSLTNLVRWQTHWYVLRHSWGYFQSDFAGRIANKVMQTGVAVRQSVDQAVDAVFYVLVYAIGAFIVLSGIHWALMLPLLVWFVAYLVVLFYYVPKVKSRSAEMSEVRSMLTGRIVDSYTNILTVKLFARPEHEDNYVREAIVEHTGAFHNEMRLFTWMIGWLFVINALLLTVSVGLSIWLWGLGIVSIGAVATVLPLINQILNMAGWIMDVVTDIFENIGTAEEGMGTISKPHTVVDQVEATPLAVTKGHIRFDNVDFFYGQENRLMSGLKLDIPAGQKVGLIGRSGAGKSTLVNLLLRFHDLNGGQILIDDQSIAGVTQDSLRGQIGMVTQDTSLLHRSVRDNIRYGRPDASEEDVIAAAKRAQADTFIHDLVDWQERRGYDAHVGERGVKLSGGQRQRVAIARVLLKDAPILILDEATSALDSEIEAAIQDQLTELMAGKTVIAIAHRLSTIAQMDRLIVMENGEIIEDGNHGELLARGGLYAELWSRQSGGFLAKSA